MEFVLSMLVALVTVVVFAAAVAAWGSMGTIFILLLIDMVLSYLAEKLENNRTTERNRLAVIGMKESYQIVASKSWTVRRLMRMSDLANKGELELQKVVAQGEKLIEQFGSLIYHIFEIIFKVVYNTIAGVMGRI